MRIPDEIVARISRGQIVTMEVPETNDQLRCFIGVYPSLTNDGNLRIAVRKFSIQQRYLDHDWDIHPEELIDRRDAIVTSLHELENQIAGWGADPARLEPPWKNAYPL